VDIRDLEMELEEAEKNGIAGMRDSIKRGSVIEAAEKGMGMLPDGIVKGKAFFDIDDPVENAKVAAERFMDIIKTGKMPGICNEEDLSSRLEGIKIEPAERGRKNDAELTQKFSRK